MIRICEHAHNLFLDRISLFRKVDAVSKGLTKLSLAVNTRKSQACCIIWSKNLWLNKCFAIYRIEFSNYFPGLLNHGKLVLANRHRSCLESGNVGCL